MIKVEITAVSRVDLLKQVEDLFNAIMPYQRHPEVPAAAPAGGNGKSKPAAETETAQEAAETTAPPRGRGRPPKGAAVRKEPEPESAVEESVFGNTAPEPEKVPVKIDKPELLKALTKFVDAFGEPATVNLLAEHGNGATKVSLLDAKDYAAVHAAALAALPNV